MQREMSTASQADTLEVDVAIGPCFDRRMAGQWPMHNRSSSGPRVVAADPGELDLPRDERGARFVLDGRSMSRVQISSALVGNNYHPQFRDADDHLQEQQGIAKLHAKAGHPRTE